MNKMILMNLTAFSVNDIRADAWLIKHLCSKVCSQEVLAGFEPTIYWLANLLIGHQTAIIESLGICGPPVC